MSLDLASCIMAIWCESANMLAHLLDWFQGLHHLSPFVDYKLSHNHWLHRWHGAVAWRHLTWGFIASGHLFFFWSDSMREKISFFFFIFLPKRRRFNRTKLWTVKSKVALLFVSDICIKYCTEVEEIIWFFCVVYSGSLLLFWSLFVLLMIWYQLLYSPKREMVFWSWE